jgi:hypothetical protein
MTSFNGLVGIFSNLVFVALYISFLAAGPFGPLLFTSGRFFFNHTTRHVRNLVKLASGSLKAVGNLRGSLTVRQRVFYLDTKKGPQIEA